MVIQKTPDEIRSMARAGATVAEVREELRAAVRPGISTAELDVPGGVALARRPQPNPERGSAATEWRSSLQARSERADRAGGASA